MPLSSRFHHIGNALAHSVAPTTWRKSFVLRPTDAVFVPAIKVGIAGSLVLVAGGLLGHEQLAGIAALGALTSAFGRYQPYRRLSLMLIIVASALLISTGIGALLGALGAPFSVQILVLSAIAALASHTFSAFHITGPGAVIMVFAAAAGSGYADSFSAVPRAVAALGIGAAVGWLVAMAPVLAFPMGPARLAVARAIAAVVSLGNASHSGMNSGGTSRAVARTAALAALHTARESVAVSSEHLHSRTVRSMSFSHHGEQLNLLLDEAYAALDLVEAPATTAALTLLSHHEAELRKIRGTFGTTALHSSLPSLSLLPSLSPPADGRTTAPSLLVVARAGLGSRASVHQALRIAAASALSGWAAAGLGLEHPLWASMGAVAALQGLNYSFTLQRGIQRMVGNVVGAALAVALLGLSLGFWPSVAMVVLFQVLAELLVMKNYTLTTIAVTPMALIMTSMGSQLGPEAALSRVADTLVGVIIGVLVAAISISLADQHHIANRQPTH